MCFQSPLNFLKTENGIVNVCCKFCCLWQRFAWFLPAKWWKTEVFNKRRYFHEDAFSRTEFPYSTYHNCVLKLLAEKSYSVECRGTGE